MNVIPRTLATGDRMEKKSIYLRWITGEENSPVGFLYTIPNRFKVI
jgi:hypothetical protein